MAMIPVQQADVRAYSFSVSELTINTAVGVLYLGSETYTVPENLTGKKLVITFESTNGNAALCAVGAISGTSLTVKYFRWDSGYKITGHLYVFVSD